MDKEKNEHDIDISDENLSDENSQELDNSVDGEDIENEDIDDDLTDEELEEDLEDESDEEDSEDESDEEDYSLDKKEKAIIKHKRENKELKDKLRDAELKIREFNREKELINDGKSEDDIKSILSKEKEQNSLEYDLQQLRIRDLEKTYPGISLYSSELINLKNKYPDFSYEELYQVKFASKNEFEKKTKREAIARAKRQEIDSKSLIKGKDNSRSRKTQLNPEDEKAYRIWSTKNPGKDRKYFKDLLNS